MNKIVSNIIEKVKTNGDSAITFFTEKYDGLKLLPKNFKVSDNEILSAFKSVDKNFLNSIILAKENIEVFQNKIFPKSTIIKKSGIVLKHIFKPLDSVGIYIPGGRFSYPSTILMTAIPAKIAGVKKIIITTPFKNLSNEVLATAKICGVNEIFRIGGAQAIAALAYGTETIPKVDKIVGPGNIFVTAAKKLVYGDAGIDFLAGPTEVVVLAEKGNPKFIAADLLAQAEHDRMASAILVTTNKKLAEDVKKEVNAQLKTLKTELIANESIRKNSAIILAGNIDEAINLVNDFAPEHLIIEDKKILDKINNAGAIFIGSYSCEAAGDYCVGNHVLPTGGIA